MHAFRSLAAVVMVGAALLAGCAARAATATPATLAQALARARGGDTIVLERGDYGAVTLPGRTFHPRLRIDASAARFSGLTLRGVEGVELRGGTVTSPDTQTFSVLLDSARDVAITGMTIGGGRVAISVARSQDVTIADNAFDGARSDGVNIAGSQRVAVERNVCRNFRPIAAVYAENGKLVRDGDHPDCIQGWSIVGKPPTSDIRLVGNRGEGFMQGIWFGNPGQGGYDRMVVRDNQFTLSLWHGISIAEVRGAEVTGNIIRAEPGARARHHPFQRVTPWIKLSGSDIRACGNTVDQPRHSDGVERCREPRKRRD